MLANMLTLKWRRNGMPAARSYIFYRGEKFQVEFYFTQKGKCRQKNIMILPMNRSKLSFLL